MKINYSRDGQTLNLVYVGGISLEILSSVKTAHHTLSACLSRRQNKVCKIGDTHTHTPSEGWGVLKR